MTNLGVGNAKSRQPSDTGREMPSPDIFAAEEEDMGFDGHYSSGGGVDGYRYNVFAISDLHLRHNPSPNSSVAWCGRCFNR